MAAFNKGDVVELKSGGPIMTVAELGDYSSMAGPQDGVSCIWFDRGRQQQSVFDSAVLKLHEEGRGDFTAVAVLRS